jgi:NADH dehydrogenase/NADH:ubiquinone oxidoreductase subunit G
MAYKQTAFPMAYGSKKHKDATMAKQISKEREEFEKENTAEEMNKDAERQGKIVYKNGKKFYQASDGSLHTGQVEDYERELAIDKANDPNKQKKDKKKQ